MTKTERAWVLAVVLLALSCRQAAKLEKKVLPGALAPQVQATIVTVKTTLLPENRTATTKLVIGNDFARATEEIGSWRLFDFKQNRVAFVDDFAKTIRYESLEALTQRRQDAAENEIDARIPRAQFTATGVQRAILGVQATQSFVRLGGYQRELWVGTHPLIPAQLFALMQASQTPSVDLPIAAKADSALLAVRGFPLLDHTELPYANVKMVVDRAVTAVERKNVDASLLTLPGGYAEVKPLERVRKTRTAAEPVTSVATTTTAAPSSPPAAEGSGATQSSVPTTTAVEKPKPAVTKRPVVRKKVPVTKKPVVKKAPVKKKPVKKAPVKPKAPVKKKTS